MRPRRSEQYRITIGAEIVGRSDLPHACQDYNDPGTGEPTGSHDDDERRNHVLCGLLIKFSFAQCCLRPSALKVVAFILSSIERHTKVSQNTSGLSGPLTEFNSVARCLTDGKFLETILWFDL